MSFNATALRHIVEDGGVSYRQSAVSYIFDCPLCLKANKLYVRKADGRCICWRCGPALSGMAEKALVALYGGDFAEYRRQLRGEVDLPIGGIELEFEDHWGEEDLFVDTREPALVGYEWPPTAVDADDPAFEPGRKYLSGRGIDEAFIRKYGVHYMPGERRVCFPYVVRGEILGWQGRYCGETEVLDPISGRLRRIPKSITTVQPDVQDRYVMFADNLLRSRHAVVCEGPTTAAKAELCGGNVATLGKNVSQRQMDFIAKYVDTVYIAGDPDAGMEITRMANTFIAKGIAVYLMRVPPHVIKRVRDANPKAKADFGDCTPEETLKAFHEARVWIPGQAAISLGGELIF